MSDAKQLTDIVASNGWIVAALTGVWGFVLRLIIGRHLRSIDRVEATLTSVERRLSAIEGRFLERDHARHR